MNVHREHKIGWIHHRRVASKETKVVLSARGFEQIAGHHLGPYPVRDDRPEHFRENQSFANGDPWHDEDPFDYTWYCVVRNHFDLWLSLFYWLRGLHAKERVHHASDRLSIDFIDWQVYKSQLHLPNAHTLFRAIGTVPNIRLIQYENLRRTMNHLFYGYGLGILGDDEFCRDKGTRTKDKPLDGYRPYIDSDVRAYIEEQYGREMSLLGYHW